MGIALGAVAPSFAQVTPTPTDLTATAGDRQVRLSWRAGSDTERSGGSGPAERGGTTQSIQQRYYVYRSLTSGGPYDTIASLLTTTSYTDTNGGAGLTNGTTYYYIVRAFTSTGGYSSFSNEASATPQPPPSGPAYVAVYATSASAIRVYWQPVPDATEYKVFRATASGAYNFSQPASVAGGGARWFDDPGLQSAQEYFYVVKAVINGQESNPSEEDSDVPNASAIPWNGTASAILTKARQIANTEPGLPTSLGFGNLRVMAPNGTIYQEGVK